MEYFNAGARRVLDDPLYPDAPADQIRRILTTGATSNGVYGLKLFFDQHSAIMPVLDWTKVLPRLSYIYLQRHDRLGQALSWARAIQTSQYRSTQPVVGQPSYDGALLARLCEDVDRGYAQWAAFFASRGLSPLTIVYEDFVAAPQTTIDSVARLMSVHPVPKIRPVRIDLTIQRDRTTQEWRERFLREQAGGSRSDSR